MFEESSNSSSGGDEDVDPSDSADPDSIVTPESDSEEKQPSQSSTSSAMQCLEELFAEGKITEDKMVRLKVSFDLLNATLKSSQESESSLLEEAKRYRTTLKHQQQELEKEELFPEGQDSDVSSMRQQLLQFNNKLLEAEEREYQMQYTLESLRVEKNFLEKEWMNKSVTGVGGTQFIALQESCQEMKMEIVKWQQEIAALTENLEACCKEMQKEQQELQDKKEMIGSKEAELAQQFPIATQLCRQNERIKHETVDEEKCKAVLEQKLLELVDLSKSTRQCCNQLDEECKTMMGVFGDRRSQMMVVQEDNNRLFKELEMSREKETVLLGQRGLLEISLNQTMGQRKMLLEILFQKTREKEKMLRSLKKMQTQLKVSEDVLILTQDHYNKTKAKKDIMPPNDDLLNKKRNLQKELNNLKLLYQEAMVDIEAGIVEQSIEKEQALKLKYHFCREDLNYLHALTRIKHDEKAKKSQELTKAQMRCSRMKQDVHGKQLQIQEYSKQYQEIQSKLAVFAKLYEITKSERNKYVNLSRIANQQVTEMREKLKIQENGIEILRTAATKKDRLLQKSRLKHVHSRSIRDRLQYDISKELWLLEDMRQKREEQRTNITKLAHMINAKEQVLLHLRKSYRTTVQSRNKIGVQLLEREQEMCTSNEKLKMQESQVHNKALDIQDHEEEIRSLKFLISEEKRQIKKCKKQMHCRRMLEHNCALLQIKLSEYKDNTMSLENALKDNNSEKRSRKLSGEDPSCEDLIKKIEQLEVQLTEKEAQLLEKELIYEQVSRLSQHICTKAENGKENKLGLAKKVNEVQDRIKKCTKKLMAVVSELAMRQAHALCLQQEFRERELQLESCHNRLKMGLAPSENIEQEWQRYIQNHHKRQADAMDKAQMAKDEEWVEYPNKVYTASEMRPNAYIPAEDSLPLPKPYGALAPFKPTKPGTTMRHMRKPVPKPIEI